MRASPVLLSDVLDHYSTEQIGITGWNSSDIIHFQTFLVSDSDSINLLRCLLRVSWINFPFDFLYDRPLTYFWTSTRWRYITMYYGMPIFYYSNDQVSYDISEKEINQDTFTTWMHYDSTSRIIRRQWAGDLTRDDATGHRFSQQRNEVLNSSGSPLALSPATALFELHYKS